MDDQTQINWDHEIALALDRHNDDETTSTQVVVEPMPLANGWHHSVVSMGSEILEMMRPNILTHFFADFHNFGSAGDGGVDDEDEDDAEFDDEDDAEFDQILIRSFNLQQPHLEPAHRSVIESLPHKKWRDARKGEDAAAVEKCCICIDQYKANDNVVLLRCGHIMHMRCGKDWFKQHGICPLCRKPIADELDPTATAEAEVEESAAASTQRFRPVVHRRHRRHRLSPYPFVRRR